MRRQGQIKDWKDDKGFGFVAPLAPGLEQAFVHINAFLNRQRRPVNGDIVTYEPVQDFQKLWQAQAIRFADEPVQAPVVAESLTLAPEQRTLSVSALPLLRILLVLLVLAILGLVGQQIWARTQPQAVQPPALVDEIPAAPAPAAAAQTGPAMVSPPPTPVVAVHKPPSSTDVGTRQSTLSSDAESSPYQCDGRTRCPQMHSCEEANWFVAHCPNTKMDGDGDGVACERQWCAGG